MKKSLFLYLFVFAALIALYLFVSSGKLANASNQRIGDLMEEVETLKESLQASEIKNLEMQYFSLENNDDALAYMEDVDLENPSQYIADKLLETNEPKGDNPLVPYAGMEGNFKINKIKVLNHKWILADFSDGKFWGELLIQYELKQDLGVDFTTLDHLLYTKGQ
ncbi:hydrolase [Maribacter sp. 2307ULW6-5]|uniref:hydrolase n=1 Tax=Maribacter sp. 2307ULW6-5 TaxID=3386275 RepID=UPI0039BD5722